MPHVLPLAALDPSLRGSGVTNLASRVTRLNLKANPNPSPCAKRPRQVALWGQEALPFGRGWRKASGEGLTVILYVLRSLYLCSAHA